MAVVVQFILLDFATERVEMDAQLFGGAGLIPMRAVEDLFDEALFKFADGFVEQNAVLYHLHYQAFQLILHVATLHEILK